MTTPAKERVHHAFAPNGQRIIGTYEVLYATAWAYVVKRVNGDVEEIDVEYMGESKVDWDSQTQDTDEHGENLYVAQDYRIIPENEIVWKPYCPGCDKIFADDELNDEGYCATCAARE